MEQLMQEIKEKLSGEPKLYRQFCTCYTNTLDKTVKVLEDGSTYVITGDIPAMWLRDSVAQLRPYLIPARRDEKLAGLLEGLVRRQFAFVLTDAYANAFNEAPNGNCWEHDETQMGPWIWERKYEVDSLCYPLQFSYLLWKNTGRISQFDENFKKGAERILEIWETEQYHEEKSDYRFIRRGSFYTDTLSRNGIGALVKSGIGMTWSGFRPSDDACTYGYLIPANMFVVVVLDYLEEIAETVYKDTFLAERARKLRNEIYEGIEQYGITRTEAFGEVYAYETDGYGQYNLMDDANVPSLLAMEYLGYHGKNPQVAQNTKKLILSEHNPYYYCGKKASGIGSPHTPVRYIWPIALAIQGLSAKTKEEKRSFLELLMRTDGGTGLMHEGFCVDDPSCYTREWFSWANAMFAELVLDYCGYQVER